MRLQGPNQRNHRCLSVYFYDRNAYNERPQPSSKMYVGVARRAGDLSRRRRRQTSRQDEAAAAATEQAAKHGWRWHVWQTLEDPGSSKLAKGVSTFVMLIITISVVNFIVGSQRDPACGYKPSGGFTPEKAYECGAYKLSDDGSALAPTLNGLETFCIMVFTVEYVLRLLCCSVAMRVSSFIFSPLNMIDLIAILPWYLDFVLGALQVEVSVEGLSVLRVIRLLRVVRVFKMSRNFQGLIVLIRTLGRSITAISLLLTFVITLIIVFATLIYQFEGRPPRCKWTAVDGYPERGQFIREDGSESPFLSIPHSFYWVLVRRARPMPPALSARPWLLASPPPARACRSLEAYRSDTRVPARDAGDHDDGRVRRPVPDHRRGQGRGGFGHARRVRRASSKAPSCVRMLRAPAAGAC